MSRLPYRQISGYAPLPLPLPAAPVTGETLASFLGRNATVNPTTPDALLEILPPWFCVKTRGTTTAGSTTR